MKKMKNKIDWTVEDETWYDETNVSSYEKLSDYTITFDKGDKHTIGYRNKGGDIYIYRVNPSSHQGKCKETLRIDGTRDFHYEQTDGRNNPNAYTQFREHIGKDVDIVIVKFRKDKINHHDDWYPDDYKLANYNGRARRVPYNELLEVVVELGDVSQHEEDGVVTVDLKMKNEKITKVNRIEEMII
tara:strand:+ start:3881 stop:4438 length:558 start_codon:yes stop_codon:yes gene_type:complete